MKNILALLLLSSMPWAAVAGAQEPKFKPLFNGRDLTGWFNINCAPGTWSVKDGMIHTTGAPICELRTERMYENFILELEWQHLKPEGNAGVFVWADALPARGEPFLRAIEVQVLDGRNTENYTSHGDVFAIHGAKMTPDRPHPNGWPRSLPKERRAKPAGQWNTYRITARDGKITLAVNGAEVSGGYDISPRKGYLALESEGSPALFRNLRIAELPSSGTLAPEHVAAADDGFRSIYNGQDLTGWSATGDGWTPKDWTLAYSAARGGASLVSGEDYGDFALIVDWRLPKDGGKSAAGKAPKEPVRLAVMPTTLTTQVLPAGEWNRSIYTVRGKRLTVTLNGKTVVESSGHEGAPRGRIVLQPAGDIEIANVFVKRF